MTTVEGIAGRNGASRRCSARSSTRAPSSAASAPRDFVMALTELFAREPRPGREQIRDALSGNLCRCSGYVKIVEAAELLAALQSAPVR